jgi:hypothetical protein
VLERERHQQVYFLKFCTEKPFERIGAGAALFYSPWPENGLKILNILISLSELKLESKEAASFSVLEPEPL